jgi:hypothetical protein
MGNTESSIEKSEISKPSVPERLPASSIKDQPLASTDAVRVAKASSIVSFKTGSENPETDDEGSDGSDDDQNFPSGHERICFR